MATEVKISLSKCPKSLPPPGQGYNLDYMSNEELSELIGSLTQAVERVRITVQLRRLAHTKRNTGGRCAGGKGAGGGWRGNGSAVVVWRASFWQGAAGAWSASCAACSQRKALHWWRGPPQVHTCSTTWWPARAPYHPGGQLARRAALAAAPLSPPAAQLIFPPPAHPIPHPQPHPHFPIPSPEHTSRPPPHTHPPTHPIPTPFLLLLQPVPQLRREGGDEPRGHARRTGAAADAGRAAVMRLLQLLARTARIRAGWLLLPPPTCPPGRRRWAVTQCGTAPRYCSRVSSRAGNLRRLCVAEMG